MPAIEVFVTLVVASAAMVAVRAILLATIGAA